jgi:uroporphyrinogen-III decarboxylase
VNERTPDPNKERNDPMVPEYWLLGEDVQDKVRLAGYEAETVEGIAVDIHDLLQAAETIQNELAPAILAADPAAIKAKLRALAEEFEHIRWHCDAALEYLEAAAEKIP